MLPTVVSEGTQEEQGTNPVAESKRIRGREQLIKLYTAHQRQVPGSLERLLDEVRKFAYTKVYHLEVDFKNIGTSETADDWAQEVTIKVWQGLNDFNGTPELFYSWVHKIAFNQATEAFGYLKKESELKVPLMVKSSDDKEEGVEEINPLLYKDDPDTVNYRLPNFIKGVDRNICLLIIDGMTYAQAAVVLNMTKSAIESRVRRLRNTLVEARKEKRPTGL